MSVVFFFFKQKTAYEMRISDWSSDVCFSDLWRRAWVARLNLLPAKLKPPVSASSAPFSGSSDTRAVCARGSWSSCQDTLTSGSSAAVSPPAASPPPLSSLPAFFFTGVSILRTRTRSPRLARADGARPVHLLADSDEHTSELQSLMRISYAA